MGSLRVKELFDYIHIAWTDRCRPDEQPGGPAARSAVAIVRRGGLCLAPFVPARSTELCWTSAWETDGGE